MTRKPENIDAAYETLTKGLDVAYGFMSDLLDKAFVALDKAVDNAYADMRGEVTPDDDGPVDREEKLNTLRKAAEGFYDSSVTWIHMYEPKTDYEWSLVHDVYGLYLEGEWPN